MTDNDQSASEENKFAKKWAILAAIMVGSLLTPLDSSIVNTVLPDITTHFHTEIAIVQWVPTVYLLAICCLIMMFGRLGDIIGHKKVFIYGLAFFTLASIMCGLSQSIWMLISFRVLQGLAAGMIMAVGFALVVAAFPASERGKALGLYATGVAVAMSIGPTLGGVIADHLGWRYIFFINAPVGVVAVIWCSRVLPLGILKPGQRLDIPGTIAFFVFLPTLLLYFNRGEEWGWATPVSLTLLAVAVVFAILFLWIEKNSEQPMLSLSLFKDRVFSMVTLSNFLYFNAFSFFIFLTPFYLKFVLDYSTSTVGLIMIASPVVMLFAAPTAGTLSDKFGTRIFAIGGMCVCALGLFLLANLNENNNAFDVMWRLGLAALGGSAFSTPNNSTFMGRVPPQNLGSASGLLAAMRNMGMVFGIAIAGAILYGLAPVTTEVEPGSFTAADMSEFLDGLQWAYVGGACMALISALISVLAIQRHKQVPG